ncbi:HET-domain-containing protein [Hyaloscypha hepaticicola]|uniref:HET-domain-containing protein n=1 Tax=Hyaloscypha hepaticicola TaxID=2082293 RepID=A0A2J6PZR1_9HELO|nr:HET-domain-containing protein [Hyaloscypha hepaticicola]
MEKFKYHPVISSLSQIRLVYLLPQRSPGDVEDEEQIRCGMKIVSLDECPEYTALSYTWGDPSPTSVLIVDNHIIQITKSVEAALLYLRHEKDTMTLWMDQLCINQEDNVEKGEQVQLMKAIYQGAKDVVAWLGPAANESDHLIDILSQAGEEASRSRLLQLDLSDEERDLEYTDSYNRLVKRLGQEPSFPMESLRSFVNKPYWTRVWIVQELSLAQDVIFACGNKRISYNHLRHALIFYAHYHRVSFKDFRDRNSLQAIVLDPEKLQTFRNFVSAPIFSPADKMLASRYKYSCQIENKGHDLYGILKYCHVIDNSEIRLEATNHLDKIYGLLGLARDTFGIRPDYLEPISEAYTNTARVLMRSGQVDLLWLCQFPKSIQKLPTWVPDWSAPLQNPYGTDFAPNTRTFSASGKRSACVTCPDDLNGFITLRGVAVDEVAAIGSTWVQAGTNQLDEETGVTSRFLAEIDQLCDEALLLGHQDPGLLSEARWRTAIGDKEHTDRGMTVRATSRCSKAREAVLSRIEPRRINGEIQTLSQDQIDPDRLPALGTFQPIGKEERSYRHFMGKMSNRRPFRSRNGYVGLGPVHMLPGDVLCIVLGAQVPYILGHSEAHRYQLLGEAYVHGIMDGEFMEKDPVIKEFTLC